MQATAHRETALLAMQNASEIEDDARILFEAGKNARALVLAVIGCEEAGKALLHTFAALNLAPTVVSAFEKRGWDSPLLNHLFKQLAVEMIGGADAELDSYEIAAAGEVGPYPAPERAARVICGCAQTLNTMFTESKGAAAGKAWFEHIGSMISSAFWAPHETPDDEKMRGLYVDLGRSTGQPMNVSYSDAGLRIATLKSTLGTLSHVRSCLEDPDLWTELCEEVGRIADEYSSGA